MSKYLPNTEIKVEDLPSRGISYPEGSKIVYQTYSFGEVQKSSTSSFVDIRGVLELALDGIETKGFDKKDLTLFDTFFLGLHRKTVSLGSAEFEMPYICKKCGERGTVVFSQKDIEFRDVDEQVTELPAVVTISGLEMEFSFVTVGEFLNHFKGKRVPTEETTALMVKNLDFETAVATIRDTRDLDEIADIEEIDKLLSHDILPIQAICTHEKEIEGIKVKCGYVNAVKLEGREALLRPFRTGKAAPRRSIQFGKKQPSKPECDQTDGVHGSDKPAQKVRRIS